MDDNIFEETVDFDEELYQKNIIENDFSGTENDGIGDDVDANKTNVTCPTSKYSIKCPYEMTPAGICVHNTANDASAMSEVSYMLGNNNKVSFHVAVDNERVVTGIPFNRNTWHCGDGGSGKGNRTQISIEICYSKSGGERFDEAENLAACYIAYLLKQYGTIRLGNRESFKTPRLQW